MSICLQERENKIATSKRCWSEVVRKYQLECITQDYSVNYSTTRLCYLTHKNLIFRGVGKGRSITEIDIGARYEAIEGCLSNYQLNPYPIIIGSPTEISNNYSLLLDRCNSEAFMKNAETHTSIPWVIYNDIRTKKPYAVLLACADLHYQSSSLENDTFNYNSCDAYASTNGLASGATYEESIIHSTLEVLERDAYSYFFIDTYVLNKPLSVIDKKTLPDDLMSLILNLEKKYQNQIIILQMPSRFGIHAYLATFHHREFEISPQGCGASLNSKYALERAIYELVQTYNLMHGYYIASKICIEKLNKNRLLKNILEFDVGSLIAKNHYNTLDFYDNSTKFINVKLPNYLDEIIKVIYDKNSSLLVNIAYNDANGLTCSRAIIPETEEFFIATHYIKINPKINTLLYIRSQLGKEFNWDNYKIL